MADPEENPPNKPSSSKPATENGSENIRRSESFTEEELAKQLKDKDIAQVVGELFKTQKVAFNYIDNRRGGVFFSDEAHISGDVVGKTQFKKEESKGGKKRPEETVSEVLVSDLKKIVSVYVSSRRYETARETLAQRNVLILCGRAHHGKCTTALHLLHNLHSDTIFELDPLANPETLDFSGKPAQGYIIDTYSTESVEKITRFQLNRLSRQLQTCGTHLVITVDERTALPREGLENYLLNWDDLPNQKDLIEKGVTKSG